MVTQQWDDPTTSYELISEIASPPASIVDIGGGASQLVDRLLENGYRDIAVVDQSQDELTAAYERVGSAPVTWTATDINEWIPERTFDVWHDRATYDELTDPDEQQHYWDLVRTTVEFGGHIVIATKGIDATAITAAMGEGFTIQRSQLKERIAPVGQPENFTWLVAQRT
ncbi:MAG: methyltransferase domain-containing protein [bacterium]|nr:methyltransferase domain-containing protein [bacterium]